MDRTPEQPVRVQLERISTRRRTDRPPPPATKTHPGERKLQRLMGLKVFTCKKVQFAKNCFFFNCIANRNKHLLTFTLKSSKTEILIIGLKNSDLKLPIKSVAGSIMSRETVTVNKKAMLSQGNRAMPL